MSGCIVFLIDESSLMGQPMPGGSGRKIDAVATAINSTLKQLCGAPVDVGLFAYSRDPFGNAQVVSRWSGSLEGQKFVSCRKLAAGVLTVEKRVRHVPQPGVPGRMAQQEIEFPVWYVPQLGELGSKAKAIMETGQSLDGWMSEHKPVAPPLVLHVVSAIYGQELLSSATAPLINWMTPVGNPIVLNILLGDNAAAPAIKYPTTDQFLQPGPSADLFQSSTVLPQFMVDALMRQKETVYPGARGQVFNGKLSDLIRMVGLVRTYAEAVYSVVGDQPAAEEPHAKAETEAKVETGTAGPGQDLEKKDIAVKSEEGTSVSAASTGSLPVPGAASTAGISAASTGSLPVPGAASAAGVLAGSMGTLPVPGAASAAGVSAASMGPLPVPGAVSAAGLSAASMGPLPVPGAVSAAGVSGSSPEVVPACRQDVCAPGECVPKSGKIAPFLGSAPDDSSLGAPRDQLVVFLLDASSSGSLESEKAWEKRLDEVQKQLGRVGLRGQGQFDVSLIAYGSDGAHSSVSYPIGNKRFVPDDQLFANAIRVETIEKQVPNGVGGLVTLKQKKPVYFEAVPCPAADVSVGMSAAVELMAGRRSMGAGDKPTLIIHVTSGEFSEATLADAMSMLTDGSLPKSVVHTWVYTAGAHGTLKYPDGVEKMTLPILARLWEQTDPLLNRDRLILDGKRPMLTDGSRGMVVNGDFDAFFDLFE